MNSIWLKWIPYFKITQTTRMYISTPASTNKIGISLMISSKDILIDNIPEIFTKFFHLYNYYSTYFNLPFFYSLFEVVEHGHHIKSNHLKHSQHRLLPGIYYSGIETHHYSIFNSLTCHSSKKLCHATWFRFPFIISRRIDFLDLLHIHLEIPLNNMSDSCLKHVLEFYHTIYLFEIFIDMCNTLNVLHMW